MALRIIIAFLIFLLVAMIALFFSSGAPQEIAKRKNEFTNPLAFLFENRDATSSPFSVSLDPIDVPKIRFSDTAEPTSFLFANPRSDGVIINNDANFLHIQQELGEQERTHDELVAQIEEAREFGSPSPKQGLVSFSFSIGGTAAQNPNEEYVIVTASIQNTAPVNITGWSLQSVVNGMRIFIPSGTDVFHMGSLNEHDAIYLDPGASAIIVSGISPVGISFQENSCTGYLDQFQEFVPPLAHHCPLPENELPVTAENIRRYGDACFNFINQLPRCELYLDQFPSSISPECHSFVREALTYNGCIARHQWRPSFPGDTWRIFLESDKQLWRDERDVIRLLDESGRTVDVLSY